LWFDAEAFVCFHVISTARLLMTIFLTSINQSNDVELQMHNALWKIPTRQVLMDISATDCVGQEVVCEKCRNVRKVRSSQNSISLNLVISCWSTDHNEGHEKLLIMLAHSETDL
jgi:hypothetical protein